MRINPVVLSKRLTKENKQALDSLPAIINKTFPIPGKYRRALPSDVAELSRLLTNSRGDRALSYLSRPNFLSAYLHYFLPWNLYRLCELFTNLDLSLRPGDKIVDLGCGPLTFVSALWITRPDLRAIPLEFHCIDRSAPVLDAGRKFFTALGGAENECLWKIKLLRIDIDIRKNMQKEKHTAALVSAVNLFNELYEDIPHSNTEKLRNMAVNTARFMNEIAITDGQILTVEPGVPQSGKFISCLRNAFMELGRQPLSPCTHTAACPCIGKEKRWCHFAYDANNAPKELHRLSAAAGIPKERLVLSYLLAGTSVTPVMEKPPGFAVRVISDAFSLPNNCYGRYGCSENGLVLLTGEKKYIEKTASGSIVFPKFDMNRQRDQKSNALIIEL
jgi:ribosomal protein RSM22 (predicted rRNA methylase)